MANIFCQCFCCNDAPDCEPRLVHTRTLGLPDNSTVDLHSPLLALGCRTHDCPGIPHPASLLCTQTHPWNATVRVATIYRSGNSTLRDPAALRPHVFGLERLAVILVLLGCVLLALLAFVSCILWREEKVRAERVRRLNNEGQRVMRERARIHNECMAAWYAAEPLPVYVAKTGGCQQSPPEYSPPPPPADPSSP
ncbi:MAG: hypothetical protein SGCHY_005095 [Lobulomycetales sp.]